MDAREEKLLARRRAREKLNGITAEEWRDISLGVCAHLADAAEYRGADSVFCFVGHGAEIDTRPFLERALRDGKALYVPRCRGNGLMEAVRIGDLDCLKPGMFGIPEPDGDLPAADGSGIALAVAPCLAADAEGYRLGRGGGYYDRFLASFKGTAILLCPEKMLLPRVPRDAWDVKCARVITERRG